MDFHELLETAFPALVEPNEMERPIARRLVARLTDPLYPAGQIIECRRAADGAELIIAELQIELGQRALTNDVRSVELVGIVVMAEGGLPSVRSLRADFPDVPHLNMPTEGEPRSLCLYDVGWNDLAAGWTAMGFLERIRWWFQSTAYGSLHGDQQPLEPLMSTSGMRLIVATDVLDRGQQGAVVFGGNVFKSENNETLFLRAGEDATTRGMTAVNWTVAVVKGPPRQHGRIARGPRSLLELIGLLNEMGVDLPGALGTLLGDKVSNFPSDLNRHLLVIATFPVQRVAQGPVEEGQSFAFLVPKTLGEIGVDLGYLSQVESAGDGPHYGIVLPASRKIVAASPVAVLEVYREFSIDVARQASGLSPTNYTRALLIGAGALGSEIADNLARTAIPSWVIVDEDALLPHNLARHALDGFAIGAPKAHALSSHISHLLNAEAATAIRADFLNPMSAAEPINAALRECEVVLDASASQPVLRSLGYSPHEARGVSAFLNPTGTDLVLLAEDIERESSLVLLEHCYLRALLELGQLAEHLLAPPNEGYRYGASCRHPSARIPRQNVAVLAGVASGQIARLHDRTGASVTVFRFDPDFGNVSAIPIPISTQSSVSIEEWRVCVLGVALAEMGQFRADRLPNETGGVLIGTIDRVNRSVYVVAALPAPSDSKERTTSFIRGVAGLRSRVEKIAQLSLGQLQYVGEWHSHPPNAGSQASGDDRKLYGWVFEELSEAEAPPLMIIAGESEFRVFAQRDGGDDLRSATVGSDGRT